MTATARLTDQRVRQVLRQAPVHLPESVHRLDLDPFAPSPAPGSRCWPG
ncbi:MULTISPECIES: hypothetical protein [Actinosynnema]|nr:hypothetical protein [Actinosynnema pretiosum]